MRRNKIKVDLTNKRFGSLVVLNWTQFRNYHRKWLCQCDCGQQKEILGTHLISGATISCGCKNHKKKSDSKCWKGYEEISGSVYSEIKHRAQKYKHHFNITIEYIWDLFLKQNKKCALSGLDLEMPIKSKSKHTASLDRIDSSKGYIKGNIQWIHKDINWMKNSFNQEYFLDICQKITKFNEKPIKT